MKLFNFIRIGIEIKKSSMPNLNPSKIELIKPMLMILSYITTCSPKFRKKRKEKLLIAHSYLIIVVYSSIIHINFIFPGRLRQRHLGISSVHVD